MDKQMHWLDEDPGDPHEASSIGNIIKSAKTQPFITVFTKFGTGCETRAINPSRSALRTLLGHLVALRVYGNQKVHNILVLLVDWASNQCIPVSARTSSERKSDTQRATRCLVPRCTQHPTA